MSLMPSAPTPHRRRLSAIAAGVAAGLVALAGPVLWPATEGVHGGQSRDPFAALKARFERPRFVPAPADNPPTPERIALGKRLFEDKMLSAAGTIACSSCHDPRLSFSDGEQTGKGITGRRLARHTPSLWNSAFSPLLFWDGRASSLEDQIRFPVEHSDEMGSTLDAAARRLAGEESYRRVFAATFPKDPAISPRTIAKAIAAYERTLVSPPTRFDAWVAGKVDALTDSESPAGGDASPAISASISPTTISMTSACPARTRGAARSSAFRLPTTPLRRRPCASWPGRRPTCTTARWPPWRTWCATMRKAGWPGRRAARTCRRSCA
jgi:cytochrome c peroxidase